MKVKWYLSFHTDAGKQSISGEEEWKGESFHFIRQIPECILDEVKAEISFPVSRDTAVFMNGYQTWTTCPEYTVKDRIRSLQGLPGFAVNQFSLDRYGDYHFVNYPYRKGVTHGESWCYFRRKNSYRLFASTDESTGYTLFQYDAGKQVLTIERDCSGVHFNGTLHCFDLIYTEGNEEEVFNTWFDYLQLPPAGREKLYGYSSWYNRYQNINTACIQEDLEGCTRILEKGDMFQIDDGWEPYVGDWLETDQTKFPGSMKETADEIHKAGYRAGLWLAPFAAEENSSLVKNHPDWLITDENGKPWKLGSNWSGFYGLNIDHPQVIEYLRKVFERVFDEWGFDMVKLDFLYGAAPFNTASESRAARMIRAMQFLREVCKDKLILGCGVPVMPAFGYVDYCRISCDVTLDWDDKLYMRLTHRERTSTKNAIANILSRRALNNRAYGSDPDVFFLRDENCSLTDQQKDLLATLDALLGNVFFISDNPANYTDQMIDRYHEYRHLTEAKVLEVSQEGSDIDIRYELDSQERSVHFTI